MQSTASRMTRDVAAFGTAMGELNMRDSRKQSAGNAAHGGALCAYGDG
jgi:hypothetical protein